MAHIDKVKIIVVGDSGIVNYAKSLKSVQFKILKHPNVSEKGVGKSSLVHLISQKEPISRPSWTIGCAVEVILHEYKEGTPHQKVYFVELWDVGGSWNHQNARTALYNGVNGIILVHDLTNRKSEENLRSWLSEIMLKDDHRAGKFDYKAKRNDEYDCEQVVGSLQIPILMVGTKLDLAGDCRSRAMGRSSNAICDEFGADEILLDCQQMRSLAAGSGSSIKLSRFFDKAVELRYYKNSYATVRSEARNMLVSY